MKISSLSFGASSLGGVFHELKEQEGIEAVHTAIDAGINFIDVSPYYGHYKAETVLGKDELATRLSTTSPTQRRKSSVSQSLPASE